MRQQQLGETIRGFVFFRAPAFVLCFAQFTVFAQSLPSRRGTTPVPSTISSVAAQAQYRFNGSLGIGMISVEAIGAVRKSGLYHVPRGTSVSDLISLAGGFTSNAELDKTTIRRRTNNKKSENFIKIDLEEYYEGNAAQSLPYLQEGDLLYVPEDEPTIDRDTSTIITAVGAVASTVLSIFLIRREITRDD